MDNLEPITRNEMFLNGDDLEPITREEMILAGADLEPITRHEWFLKKYRGGGGGGGYDLVNVPNLPADIASFTDGTDLPMASLKVAVTPYQDLSHGDPSPENICPISGWDEAVVTVADDAESPTTSHEYTIDLDGTRYGGTLDVVSGVLVVDRVGIKGVNVARVGQAGSGVRYADTTYDYADLVQNTTTISDRYVQINTSQSGESGKFRVYNRQFTIYDDRFTDTTTAQSLLNDVEFCYELATPITVQLTPTAVKSIEGENNIFADCGQITEVKYFKKA